jgi:hypothetical protein
VLLAVAFADKTAELPEAEETVVPGAMSTSPSVTPSPELTLLNPPLAVVDMSGLVAVVVTSATVLPPLRPLSEAEPPSVGLQANPFASLWL